MAIKYTFAKNAAELEAIQAKAVKSVNSARVSVQIAAVATIRHAFEHGDWSYAGKLVEALGSTVNGSALVEWFKTYGGLKTDDNGFCGWSGKGHIEANFQEAKAKMWWVLKPQTPFKGFDLDAALKKVLAAHTRAQKEAEGMSEEDKAKIHIQVNDDTIKAVLSLCHFEPIMQGEANE